MPSFFTVFVVFKLFSSMRDIRNTFLSLLCLVFLYSLIVIFNGSNNVRFLKWDQFSSSFNNAIENKRQENKSLQTELKFLQSLNTFDWDKLKIALEKENFSAIWDLVNDFIRVLTPFLLKEPLVPVNSSCQPPVLKSLENIKCENGSRKNPVNVGFLMQLGFDVDVLEIHLNELFDVVDHFFIIESTRTHSIAYRKPLIWECVKDQPRFQKFHSKIVHFVIDDSYVEKSKPKNASSLVSFTAEKQQERLRWERFLQWNAATGFFSDDDILGFGDSDEIANRETVNYLKNCILESDPIDVGIWFPFGRIDQAYLTDFPLYQHPFTLGDPTFWSLGKAKDNATIAKFYHPGYPTRNRGRSLAHVLGGMHMSHYGYLPFLLIKHVTLSEGSLENLRKVAQFPDLAKTMSMAQLQRFYSEDYYKKVKYRVFKLERVEPIDPEKKKIVILPWFYDCNRQRYPAWEGMHDTRLS